MISCKAISCRLRFHILCGNGIAGRLIRSLSALFLAISISVFSIPVTAHAESRPDDIIGNRTVAESGIPAAAVPSVSSGYAYVADSDGTVYFQRNADERTHIASITKIMTALVALEYGEPGSLITVSENAASVGESTSGLQAGDVLSLEDAVKGLMVPSGNDAAVALAENVGRTILAKAMTASSASEGDGNTAEGLDRTAEDDSPEATRPDSITDEDAYEAFVDTMNTKAAELGCENTLFANPHGLDDEGYEGDMYSSAHDVALISAAAMDIPFFKETVGAGDTTIAVVRDGENIELPLESTDLFLQHYEGAAGIKTGYTDAAGYCFSGAAERDGTGFYAVVLDSSDEIQRFDDVEALLDWAFGSMVQIPVSNSDQTVEMTAGGSTIEVPVVAWVSHSDWNDRTFPVAFADHDAVINTSSAFGNISQQIVIERSGGTIKQGDIVGHADFYQHNQLIHSEDLVACETVEAPSILDSIAIGWSRLFGSDEDGDSETVIVNEMPVILQKS